jgi:tetratricopeptide (TPR) repeat protein
MDARAGGRDAAGLRRTGAAPAVARGIDNDLAASEYRVRRHTDRRGAGPGIPVVKASPASGPRPRRLRGAGEEAKLAVALARNSAFALYAAADIASVFERWDEAEGLLRQALAVDPLDPDIRNLLGWTLYRQGHFKAAELEGRRVVQVRPSYFTGHLDLGLYLLAEGESQLALGEMQQELSDTARPVGVAIALSALGRNAEADAALRVAERDSAQEFAYFIAGAHAFRGETDAAFQWLDRAYVQKDFLLEYIKGEPLLKSLVADPRYKAFLRKMNLPE